MDRVPNICAGPFGALYDAYIERPWLMRMIGRAIWGIDASILYTSMQAITQLADGSTVLDVPCGGGVAFRALSPKQEIRYLAGDLDARMLERARRRAARRSLKQVEIVKADMTSLPFSDEEADLFVSFSGLHMVPNPEHAVHEIARCLRPGGQLIGTTFLAEGSRRGQAMFKLGSYSGHPRPPRRENLHSWLTVAGIADARIGHQLGFTTFTGHKARR